MRYYWSADLMDFNGWESAAEDAQRSNGYSWLSVREPKGVPSQGSLPKSQGLRIWNLCVPELWADTTRQKILSRNASWNCTTTIWPSISSSKAVWVAISRAQSFLRPAGELSRGGSQWEEEHVLGQGQVQQYYLPHKLKGGHVRLVLLYE